MWRRWKGGSEKVEQKINTQINKNKNKKWKNKKKLSAQRKSVVNACSNLFMYNSIINWDYNSIINWNYNSIVNWGYNSIINWNYNSIVNWDDKGYWTIWIAWSWTKICYCAYFYSMSQKYFCIFLSVGLKIRRLYPLQKSNTHLQKSIKCLTFNWI